MTISRKGEKNLGEEKKETREEEGRRLETGVERQKNHKEMEIRNIEEEEEKGKKETTEKWSYLLN